MGKFVGKYDTIPAMYDDNVSCNDPDMYVFQSDYGFLRDDYIMTISPKGTLTDGASIPPIAQLFMGHPLEKNNKYWSANHDSSYKNTVIIINCENLMPTMSALRILKCWRELHDEHWFIHRSNLNRKWWDENLVQAMECWGEPEWKKRLVYAGVWLGGWASWKKNKPLKS